MNKLIIFLIRKKLGLKKGEYFQFDNQKSTDIYWFTDEALMKDEKGIVQKSNTSMNWLLDKECLIRKVVHNENIKIYN